MEVFAVVPCLFGVVVLVLVVLWVIALIDVLQRSDAEFPGAMKGQPNANERLVWILVVLLGNTLGAIVYYFVVMQPYPRQR
ncbi:MAG TPA: PLDc N-terminal domain-containing protein [Coriobacteriia bacterium]|nr:PLDc N-terminal domain-containing protein [Coriobacteriia bacterium]